MKRARSFILLTLLVGSLTAPARASGGLLVDAGSSLNVDVWTPFSLQAHVEGQQGPIEVAWVAPVDCTLDTLDALLTTATCTDGGTKTFAITVDDGQDTASDTVRIAVYELHEHDLVSETGTVTLGLPDEVTDDGTLGDPDATVAFDVPPDTAELFVSLDWGVRANDFDLEVTPDGPAYAPLGTTALIRKPDFVDLDHPAPGTYTATIHPKVVVADTWTLDATGYVAVGDVDLPAIQVQDAEAPVGDVVTLHATLADAAAPAVIAWEDDPSSFAFDDGTGPDHDVTVATTTTIRAKVTDARGFESITAARVRAIGPVVNTPRPFTVVAVVDSSFSPYPLDFAGAYHPWNTDGDPSNDFDFEQDPASYIDGFPGADPIDITVPSSPNEVVSGYPTGPDATAWASMRPSTLDDVSMYWFPGTKIIGAVQFSDPFRGDNSAHGTRSAASAVGNIHGTCPTCVVVMITGGSPDGLRWAASQPWIDVVTNSYGASVVGGLVRDNIYFGSPVAATRAAAEAGQTIVFSAGNGLVNAYDVPMLTYWSSEKGPDWMVTVGAVSPSSKQTYIGHGKPVDISSIGDAYPSTGGTTAGGTGTHNGTSNAAPTVAGTFASVIQDAREALGDLTEGHAGGIVASGDPLACGPATPSCVLGDGVLTREELYDVVFHSVEPSPQRIAVGQTIPTTPYAYYMQGRGVISGLIDGAAAWETELGRITGLARGTVAAPTRPAGEENWFVVDSYCRQRLWGAWDGGYYRGTLPDLDPQADPIARAFLAWCERVPQDAFGSRTPD